MDLRGHPELHWGALDWQSKLRLTRNALAACSGEPGAQCVPWLPSAPKGGDTTSRLFWLSTENRDGRALRVARPAGARDRVPASAFNTCRGTLRTVGAAPVEVPAYCRCLKCCRSLATLLWHCSSEQTHTSRSSNVGCVGSPDTKVAGPRPSTCKCAGASSMPNGRTHTRRFCRLRRT